MLWAPSAFILAFINVRDLFGASSEDYYSRRYQPCFSIVRLACITEFRRTLAHTGAGAEQRSGDT